MISKDLRARILPHLKHTLPAKDYDKIDKFFENAYATGTPPIEYIVMDLEWEEAPAICFNSLTGAFEGIMFGEELANVKAHGRKL